MKYVFLAAIPVLLFIFTNGASVPSRLTITVDTGTLINPSLPEVGYNNHMSHLAYKIEDPAFQQAVKDLGFDWIRWPAGTATDSFDWKTGYISRERNSQLASRTGNYHSFFQEGLMLKAKGPQGLLSYYNAAIKMGLKLIIDVNGFTSSPEETGELAKYCLDHGIQVSGWQLANEPYYFQFAKVAPTNFYLNATDYADKMKLHFDAIRRYFPTSPVFIYYSTDGSTASWDGLLFKYPNPYWTGITYHNYEGGKGATMAEGMSSANATLATIASRVDDGYLKNSVDKNLPILISELNTSPNPDNIVAGTIYNSIFLAEAQMRLSAKKNVKFLASLRLSNGAINSDLDLTDEAMVALQTQKPFDATGRLVFSRSLEGNALKLVHEAIADSVSAYSTSTTGSALVSAGAQTISGVYAQAYKGRSGKDYLLVTNKSNRPYSLALVVGKNALSNTNLGVKRISSTTPEVTSADVQSQSGMATVEIPAYSVNQIFWSTGSPAIPKIPFIQKFRGVVKASPDYSEIEIYANLSPLVSNYEARVQNLKTGYERQVVPIRTNPLEYRSQKFSVFKMHNGVQYSLMICPAGAVSTATCSAQQTIVAGAPPEPLYIKAYKGDNGQVIVHWDSCARADDYALTIFNSRTGATDRISTPMTAYVVDPSVVGDSFSFSVVAQNGLGQSTAVSTNFSNAGDILWAPSDAAVERATDGSCKVHWTPAVQDMQNYTFEGPQLSDWTLSNSNIRKSAITSFGLPNTVMTINAAPAFFSTAILVGKDWPDASFQSDLLSTTFGSTGGAVLGMAVRYQDMDNYLGVEVASGGVGSCGRRLPATIRLVRKYQGDRNVLATKDDICLSPNERIGVDVVDKHVMAYRNSLVLLDATISPDLFHGLPSGSVAVYARDVAVNLDRMTVMRSPSVTGTDAIFGRRNYIVERALGAPTNFQRIGVSPTFEFIDTACSRNSGVNIYYRVFGQSNSTHYISNVPSNIATLPVK